jgi:hypothetical protein
VLISHAPKTKITSDAIHNQEFEDFGDGGGL